MPATSFADQSERPSLTARAAAAYRAAHQSVDGARVFNDPLAVAILGDEAPGAMELLGSSPFAERMRRFIAVRSRLAEDALHAAMEHGVTQLVVLGAGLDTYAYRGRHRNELKAIFEVDHPGTQAWKRRRLAEAGIEVPGNVRLVAANFEHGKLADSLRAAGLDGTQGVFFMWLGVIPYLTREAIDATLSWIASFRLAHVVFDYPEPPAALGTAMREMHDHHARRVAAIGEAWKTSFEPAELHAHLRELGFATIHDVGPRGIAQLFFPHRVEHAPERGAHMLHAATV
jgi:methyltransferase (TIGR00027 family)